MAKKKSEQTFAVKVAFLRDEMEAIAAAANKSGKSIAQWIHDVAVWEIDLAEAEDEDEAWTE